MLVILWRSLMKQLKICLLLAALIFPFCASAEYYGGISAGTADNDIRCGSFTCDRSDSAFKLTGGYHFTPLFAGEIIYFDFGEGTIEPPFTTTVDLGASGLGIGA